MVEGQEKLKRNLSEKVMKQKSKKNGNNGSDNDPSVKKKKKNRLLVSVNVLGSSGPIRFVVSEDDPVSTIIQTSLKNYAREGRLPLLGIDINNFVLYGVAQSDALNPTEAIGMVGGRNFLLCKKQMHPQMTEARSEMISRKGSKSWKVWLNKSLSFKSWLQHQPLPLHVS
ncbi:hypothetical protein MLD38_000053 [Melastoma candidum]|uniref:Uncharacterized protein n=1 Tax=Melastoma candidum TaxID=119954 RepID=A0ACB9SCS6_9MYRT|nr:hypothetical protein MLD38_000053 [Melastoma candidum]